MTMSRGHRVELLKCGAEFFPALLNAIDASHREVRLETYIFRFDATGESVAAALERAAQRGVAVYLVMDGIGTPEVPVAWSNRFEVAGVHWHQFSPLGTWGLLLPGRWRRMHRKLCVVDGAVLFCGGINILDDHFEFDHGVQELPRFDFAVRVTGPLVADAHAAMLQFWQRLEATRQIERGHLAAAGTLLSRQAAMAFSAGGASREPEGSASDLTKSPKSAQTAPAIAAQNSIAELLLRDNVRNRTRIERAYRQAIASARHEVVIANAYFVPGAKLRRALVHAARRGVRVQLLLQGRYEYFMQFHAAKPIYNSLLSAGVEIFEYQAGYLHAKVAVVDGNWATVGSSNLDPLSLLLAREANVAVDDGVFAQGLLRHLKGAMQHHSQPVEKTAFGQRPLAQRAKDWLGYWVMRVTLFLTGTDY